MKIIFNLTRVGLGNNGGSRTVVKTAKALSALGHKVVLFGDIKNKYTWEKINKYHAQIVVGRRMPAGDAVIATGFKSVPSTVSSSIRRKFYFIRGYETWQASEEKLLKSYRSLNCIVNSGWLQKTLKDKGVNSHLVFNGLDFDVFSKSTQPTDREYPLGGLLNRRHVTKRHIDIQAVAEKMNFECRLLNKHIKNATPVQLNNFYNNIKVWMAPTELEGLHNPPMEASLSGCGLVCTDHERSGMTDYAIHNETALVYPSRNLDVASDYIKQLLSDDVLLNKLNNNMVELLREKVGTREDSAKKFISALQS